MRRGEQHMRFVLGKATKEDWEKLRDKRRPIPYGRVENYFRVNERGRPPLYSNQPMNAEGGHSWNMSSI